MHRSTIFTVLSIFLLSVQAAPLLFDQVLEKRDYTGRVRQPLESSRVLTLLTADHSGNVVQR